MRKTILSVCLIGLCAGFCCFYSSVLQAQISLDGSLGTSVPLSGPHYDIGADAGKQVGNNLFHSFREFNINKGEIATFSGPDSISTIISRVTGGKASLIDGVLRSTIPEADMFFLNPSGIMFGKNAFIDIRGSFHVSTADYLRLKDGGRFEASEIKSSLLTASPPSAFGFLKDSPADIDVSGGILSVPDSRTLSLAGGNIAITEGILSAKGGQINMVSAASPGEAVLNDSGIDTTFGQMGKILLSEGSRIDVGNIADSSGKIYIRGGRFEVKGQVSSVSYLPENDSRGEIDIRVSDDLMISDAGQITTALNGEGYSGSIRLDANRLEISGTGAVFSGSFDNARSGDISVTARESVSISGLSGCGLYADALGDGHAGNITVTTGDLTVTGKGLISSVASGNGQSGDIALNTWRTDISDGGIVLTSSFGYGKAGDIWIDAFESLRLAGTGGLFSHAEGQSGTAGHISVSTKDISVSDDARISTSSNGDGEAGDIEIEADHFKVTAGGLIITAGYGSGSSGDISVNLSGAAEISGFGTSVSGLSAQAYGTGNAGNISLTAKELLVADEALLTAETKGIGKGGTILLDTEKMNILRGGEITSGTEGADSGGDIGLNVKGSLNISGIGKNNKNSRIYTYTKGKANAGNISVSAGTVTIEDSGTLASSTSAFGKAGSVTVESEQLDLSGGGKILSGTTASGHGGDISVKSESISISGTESEIYAVSDSTAKGDSGNISISGRMLSISDKGRIADHTYSKGKGGDITIDAEAVKIIGRGNINADTSGTNEGGDISLTARESLIISESGEISAKTMASSGNAGNIGIDSGLISVSNNGLINNGTLGQGKGGDIRLNADRVELNKGYISSGSENEASGFCGDIAITARETITVAGSGVNDDGGPHAEYYGIYSQTQGSGNGGNIRLSTDEMNIVKDGWINGQTYGSGKGGNVVIDVNRLNVREGGTVTTSTRCTGDSGDISIHARESVAIAGAGAKQPNSWIYTATHSSGSGGNLSISTPDLTIGEKGLIYADTLGDDNRCDDKRAGSAGNISLDTDRLEINNGGAVSAGTQTQGKGGDIAISARESVTISGSGNKNKDGIKNSGIYASTRSAGQGGIIRLSTDSLALSDNAEINTSASETGEGGNIELKVRQLEMNSNGSVTAESFGSGNAGNISVNASDWLRNQGGAISTESAESQGGSITINTPLLFESEKGFISASVTGGGSPGGDVEVNVGKLDLSSGGHIESSTKGEGLGGKITVTASDSLSLSGKDSGLYSKAYSSGDAGFISITTPYLTLRGYSEISTESSGSGKAGNIRLEDRLRNLILQNAAVSSSNSGTGDAGEIRINAEESLFLESSSISTEASEGRGGSIAITTPVFFGSEKGIVSASIRGGDKKGGNVTMEVSTLDLDSGSCVESSTGGAGQGGEIHIRAMDSINLWGEHSGLYSKAASSGDAGFISVTTPYLTLRDYSEISTESSGSGKAGNIRLEDRVRKLVLQNAAVTSSNSGTGDAGEIRINAEEAVLIESGSVSTEASEGRGGSIAISAPMLSGSGKGSISASVSGSKNGGDVSADVSSLALDKGFRIESSTRGPGNGGYVHVNASESLSLSGQDTGLYSTADSSGQAGRITAAAPDLTLTDGADISTESSATGKAGDIALTDDIQRLSLKNASVSSSNTGTGEAGKIAVKAREAVLLESGSITTTATEGKGGNITITTPEVSVSAEGSISAGVQAGEKEGGKIEIHASDFNLGTGSRIESSSLGRGNAGDILIQSDRVRMLDGSAITTEADFADGGNISVNARSAILMTDSDITATVRGGKGDGGNISIDPELVLLKNSRIIADAYRGSGGNIHIEAGMFVRSSNSRISASSQLGIEGSVEIESSRADIGDLTALPSDVLNNRPWLQTLCSEPSDKTRSRFVALGRDALPTGPDDWLASPPLPFKRTEIPGAELLIKGQNFCLRGDFIHSVEMSEQAIPLLTTDKKTYLQALTGLSYAYQSLGYHKKSLSLFENSVSEFEKNPLFLSAFGDLFLSSGRIADAEKYLRQAENEARILQSPDISASALNNKGNLLASQGNYQKAAAAYSESLRYIEEADRPGTPELKSKVLINTAHAGYMQKQYKETEALLDKAFQHSLSLKDSYHKASDFISLAILCRKLWKAYPAADRQVAPLISRALDEAGRIAEDISNVSMLSQACGYLGQFYEDRQRYDEAIQLTRRALFFAQQGNFPEISYLWQWQLGRLFKAKGDIKKSLDAYYQAIQTLKPIRKEFFKSFRAERFYEKLKPVYLDLTELLLKQAETAPKDKQQEILKEAMNIMELLKVAELENYFEEECLTAKPRTSPGQDSISSRTAIIYPILFSDHLTLLLTLSEGIKQVNIPANAEEIKKRAAQFRERLQDGSKMSRILYQSKPLYDWLIRPLESELTARNIDTLIIAPDSILRLIPFAALHDGHRFLIEKYAVVTIPAVILTDTDPPVRMENARVLLNGISEGVQGFDPLPGVEQEFEELRKLMKSSSVFLNETYTAENLFQEFEKHDYDIVFMATHGVFGGRAGDSFLLTYNSRLTMNQMEELMTFGKQRQVGLLMLNACQTAIGDERAALGLGGIALKAGAKSAVATLWSVGDESAFRMITEFYRQLGISGMSKAKALQNAQKNFIAAHPHSHPTYWSPFLLIGNWS